MALGDGKAKQEAQEIKEEISFLLDAVSSIGDKLVDSLKRGGEEAGDVSKILKRGIVNDINQAVRNTEEFVKFQIKAEKGLLKQSEIQKLQLKLEENQLALEIKRETLKLQGVENLNDELEALEKQVKFQEETLERVKSYNKEQSKSFGFLDLAKSAAEGLVSKIDKSGKLSKIFNGELNKAQKLTLLSDAAFAILIKGIFAASDNIANIAKNTGLSADESQRLQQNFAIAALESGKLFVNSRDLNKAFAELSNQTGLIADFGGQTLITQTTLTKQLGLSAGQASRLSLLSRIQDKNTENVLSNTIKTVGAISKQNGIALNAKSILEEISNTSAAITISLGKNPIALAEAAAQAKIFGTNLATVDAIASSLLDFESSIINELQAELLIGQNINLEKARLLALNNDLSGLSKELANQEEVIQAFATGNRIQQEAAAAAIGLSRDQLAEIALQQEFNNLSAQQFKDTYGDITYQQLQSQSASEKFASTLEAIQGIIGDIGIAFAPFLDGLAAAVGFLAKNKIAAAALVGVLTTLASISLANAIANIFASSFLTGGLAGPVIAAASVIGLMAAIGSAKSMITADDMISPPGYGDRILSTPKGTIALNNQDTIVAGTNLGGDNTEAKRTNQLLEKLLNQPAVFRIGTDEFYTATSKYSYQIQ